MSRYGQLTYTADAQGFGVKARTGRVEAPVEELMVSHLAGQAGFGREMPPYPTLSDEPLPRRLVWAPLGVEDAWGLWHSAHAGMDATGRPNNVFSHCVIDWAPQAPSPHRPIEWWRSPELCTPRGAREVADVHLPSEVPAVGSDVSAASAINFLTGESQVPRIDVLRLLLDTLQEGERTRRPVILVTENVETAAAWVGLVSRCMSPASARHFAFSLLELPSDQTGFQRALSRGLRLLCVPREHAAPIAADPQLLLIDDAAAVESGLYGGDPHRLRGDVTVPVSAWSTLAEGVLGWPDGTTELDALDAIARRVGDPDLHPAWPMAMYTALHLDDFPQLKLPAAEVLTARSPATELPADWIDVALRTVTEPDDQLREHWAKLRQVRRPSTIAEVLWRHFIDLARRNASWWLTAESREPLQAPFSPWREEDYLTLAGTLSQLQSRPHDVATAVINVILAAVHRDRGTGLTFDGGLRDLVLDLLFPALLHSMGRPAPEGFPPLPAAAAAPVRAILEGDPGAMEQLRCSPNPSVLAWLVPDYRTLAEQQAAHTPITALAASAHARHTLNLPDLPQSWIRDALGTPSARPLTSTAEQERLLRSLWPETQQRAPLPPDQLADILRHAHDLLPEEWITHQVLGIENPRTRRGVAEMLPVQHQVRRAEGVLAEAAAPGTEDALLPHSLCATALEIWGEDQPLGYPPAEVAWRVLVSIVHSALSEPEVLRLQSTPPAVEKFAAPLDVQEAATYFENRKAAADACAAGALARCTFAPTGDPLIQLVTPERTRLLDAVVVSASRGMLKTLPEDALRIAQARGEVAPDPPQQASATPLAPLGTALAHQPGQPPTPDQALGRLADTLRKIKETYRPARKKTSWWPRSKDDMQ